MDYQINKSKNMEEWKKYYNEAVDFSKVSQSAAQKGKLGNVVIYHMVSMAIEGFMTGILIREGYYSEHSSISGMMREIKKRMTVPDEFSTEVRFLNSFMNFCSLEVVPERIPSDEEIKRMSLFISDFHAWVDSCLFQINKAS